MLFIFRFCVFTGLWLLPLSMFGNPAGSFPGEATAGKLYVSQKQIQHEIIHLDGEWEFYWHSFQAPHASQIVPPADGFIRVPGVWNNFKVDDQPLPGQGYATYRLQVKLEDSVSALALRMKTVSTAATLYVNGDKVYQVGNPSSVPFASLPAYAPDVIRLPAKAYTSLDIVLQVSNYHYRKGGLWHSIYLGKEEILRQHRDRILYYDFFLIGSILMIGLYHLVLFFLKKQDISTLYFGLFCLCVVLRILTTNEYALLIIDPSISWITLIRLEYLSFIWGLPAFTAFVRHVFKEEFYSPVFRCSIGTGVVGTLIVLLTSPQFFTHIAIPNQLLILGFSFYGFFVVLKAWRRKKEESGIFLIGFTIFFLTLINDILYSNEIIQTSHYFPDGLLVFIFAQSFLLAIRFSKSFRQAEQLSQQLNTLNNTLERSVYERTASLQEINEDLQHTNEMIAAQNETLTKLNSELDQFVYSVSHDLRAPITSALGLIEVARYEQDPEQVKNYMDLQEKSLLKLDQFIQSVLDYSRNARTPFQFKEVSLGQVVAQAQETYAYLPDFDKIHWEIELDETGVLISDERRMAIVINNLISNSIRYADFRKAKPTIRITFRYRPGQSRLVIQDNGIGIEKNHLPHIFDMFYRANAYAKGSGLGLFIVKETIEKLQGRIRVYSRAKEGTTFIILLPDLRSCPVADFMLV